MSSMKRWSLGYIWKRLHFSPIFHRVWIHWEEKRNFLVPRFVVDFFCFDFLFPVLQPGDLGNQLNWNQRLSWEIPKYVMYSLDVFKMAGVTLFVNGCDEIENLLKFCEIPSERIQVKDTEDLLSSKVTIFLWENVRKRRFKVKAFVFAADSR